MGEPENSGGKKRIREMDENQEQAIEWACQKIMRQYYQHVDRYEYDEAILLFTPDVDWLGLGVKLDGRDQILQGLHGGLGGGTIRHMLTNVIVDVIDEDHANASAYNTLYSSPDIRYDQFDGPINFRTATQVVEQWDEFTRTLEGWRISKRRGEAVFKRDPTELIPLHTWAEDEGKMASKS